MKTNSHETFRLFQDHPLPDLLERTPLHAIGLDGTDYLDVGLRVILAVSLLGSLMLCSREVSDAPSRALVQRVTAVAPAVASAAPVSPRPKPAFL